jgi:hypothetical protein
MSAANICGAGCSEGVFSRVEIIVFVAQVTTCLGNVWFGFSLVLVLIVDSQFFSNLGFSLRFGERLKLRACVRPEHSRNSSMICVNDYGRSDWRGDTVSAGFH